MFNSAHLVQRLMYVLKFKFKRFIKIECLTLFDIFVIYTMNETLESDPNPSNNENKLTLVLGT